MGPHMPGLEDMQRKLDALKATAERAESQQGDLARMREEITAIEESATSSDKTVTVTAGPGGAVTNVSFTQEAMRLSAIQLSSTVMSTLRQAVAAAARKQAEIVQGHVPEGDVLERVLQTQEEMLGTSIERPTSDSGQQSSARHDDDDEGPDSFLDSRGY